MGLRLDVPVLSGSLVRLEPLSVSHAADLARAAEEDRSAYGFTVVPRAGEVAEYLAAQLARDGLTCFAQVRVRDGAAVGCTSYCQPRTWPGQGVRNDLCAVEVGWTWLAASAQGTGINAEAKFLLFSYAFEAERHRHQEHQPPLDRSQHAAQDEADERSAHRGDAVDAHRHAPFVRGEGVGQDRGGVGEQERPADTLEHPHDDDPQRAGRAGQEGRRQHDREERGAIHL